MFYWFFESRNKPEEDPLVIWLTGGPGCSSLTALFFENGPYTINDQLNLTMNPNSWNEVSNIMWIDQPVGSGFSYADHFVDNVYDEVGVAEDLYQFLQGFLKKYPKYRELDFYITGESYAGHYIPAFGKRIVEGNNQGSNPKINLKGVAIGNGWVDPYEQYGAYASFMEMKGLIGEAATVVYNTSLSVCRGLIDSGLWPLAFYECSLGMEGVMLTAEAENMRTINPYDVRIKCEVEPLCYDFGKGDKFLNQESVKKALGAKTDITWESCNMVVHLEMIGDWIGNFALDVPTLLSNDIDVLVYSGTEDWICNYLGGQAWVNNLKWPGQNTFAATELKDWKVGNEVAGKVKSYKGFTFLEVFGAGHMVPMDQPKNSLEMLTTFIHKKPFTH
eukprot:TRINITY_DN2187_c0_g1_i2.p1 TRINITY_DN2187_c0_g1~~TRINITY_DN2187_c0_g1_i2.p1  ORF type:complete len:389 (-),score=96.79 TRINITY_DN2187_c0_g1_i2:625-1791(-)